MELSGHSPFIVFDDVDLDRITDIAMLQNLEIMDKYVFPQADFIFKKIRKMNLLN